MSEVHAGGRARKHMHTCMHSYTSTHGVTCTCLLAGAGMHDSDLAGCVSSNGCIDCCEVLDGVFIK